MFWSTSTSLEPHFALEGLGETRRGRIKDGGGEGMREIGVHRQVLAEIYFASKTQMISFLFVFVSDLSVLGGAGVRVRWDECSE